MNNLSQPNQSKIALSVAVFRILRALAKFTLRQGMSIGALSELLRRAYLEAATDLIREEKSKVTTSRVCAMTGMYRKEVRRLEQLPAITDTEADDKYNRSVRVVSGWLRDDEFRTKSGKPAALKLDSDNGFDELVRRYSGDMTPTAMREELERLGIINVSDKGMIKLETEAYLNSSQTDGIQILGTDTADLINTISHNLTSEPAHRRFQRKVSYTEIPASKVDDFYVYAQAESQKLLEALDRWLAQTEPEKENYRLGVGIYHFAESESADEDASL